MKIDYLILNNGQSTYSREQAECLNIKGNQIRFLRIENFILKANNHNEVAKAFEIKTLDSKTGLKELKCSKIRVIHFIYESDTFVFLGAFNKASKKTPSNVIKVNNERIALYKNQKKDEK